MAEENKLPLRDEKGRFAKGVKKKVAPKKVDVKPTIAPKKVEEKKVERKAEKVTVEVKAEPVKKVESVVHTSLQKDMYKRTFEVTASQNHPFSFKDLSSSYYKLLSSESEFITPLKYYISHGETFIRQTFRSETKAFDDTFINELEIGLDAVGKILANPRTFIKEESDLVEAGLAKKISAVSIRHFATNSRYLRNVDEDGEVTPKKILEIHAETDTAIYENRFVMTLLKRCLAFIQTRYYFVIEHGETRDSDLLQIHNKTEIDGITYEVDSRIKISTPSDDSGNSEKNDELLRRLTVLRQNCAYYLRSPFMESMKGAKDVSSPIHMTNMLRKHPEYHKAYLLWVFLDQYEDLGINYEVKEYNQVMDAAYKEEVATYIANSILAIHSNRVNPSELKAAKPIKFVPKVVFSLEDETYADSRFLFEAYPPAKAARELPLPPLPEEVRLENEAMRQRLKNQQAAKTILDKVILEDKDRIVYEETLKRVHKQKALNNERLAYINEALELQALLKIEKEENARLHKEISSLEDQVSVIKDESVSKIDYKVALSKLEEEKASLEEELKKTKAHLERCKSRPSLREFMDSIKKE